MSTLRKPVVSGLFYPNDPSQLREMVTGYLRSVPVEGKTPKAIIVPHAAYIYSGPIAASAYVRVAQGSSRIKRVVLLGPAHRISVDGLALPRADAFETPLGIVPVDHEAIKEISKLSQVCFQDEAHDQEHSLEVQIPFLQVVLEDFSLVPFALGDAVPRDIGVVLDQLWGGPETLIVVSSDLSHYHDYETAQKMDTDTTQSIVSLGAAQIRPDQACGCYPINGLLNVAHRRGMSVELLDLRNSGDTAGPRDQVVGYGSYVFT